ncbi:Uncharacterised protein [Mycobacterium tuberculosis]|nr:Uncharacterised protein [Mycobacterium tuberculosis]
MLGDQHAQTGGIFQGAAHDQRVMHADPVVGEHPHLGGAGVHHAHLGQLGSGQPDGDRADGVHVDQADLLAAVPDVVGDHRAVGHGVGVGHREHRGVAAQSGRGRTGFDVLGILAARLAQMGVQIDEPGQQHVSGGVNDIGRIGDRQIRSYLGDLAVIDEYVDPLPLAVGPHTTNQHAHAAPSLPASCAPTSTWNSTAIRTWTPLETCCSTADCDESATEDVISMPRTIGPGCNTTAWPGSIAWRRSVSP